MQIQQEQFLDFIGKADARFVIPVFQRVYSWDARQCEELWEDILRAGESSGSAHHFMGMVLYSQDAKSWQGMAQLNIIDGQQRITTLSLLLCAFARYLDESKGEAEGIDAGEIFRRYLHVGSGAKASGKLVLSNMDRDTLFGLVGTGVMPEEPASRLIDNLELFFAKMRESGFSAERLWRGLRALDIASVLLTYDDGPQLVFESLNSKGMALTLADRVRNYIVVTDDARGNDALYEESWLPFERQIEPEADLDVTKVLNAWLAGKYRDVRIFDESEVYGVFKTCLRSNYGNDLAALLSDASSYAQRLIDDSEWRLEELENAARWVAGKPKELISEYKMFGD